MFVRYKLYGQKEYVGSVFIYESDDLNDAKNHYEEVEVDLELIGALFHIWILEMFLEIMAMLKR